MVTKDTWDSIWPATGGWSFVVGAEEPSTLAAGEGSEKEKNRDQSDQSLNKALPTRLRMGPVWALHVFGSLVGRSDPDLEDRKRYTSFQQVSEMEGC